MSLEIRPYIAEDEKLVSEFNSRLRVGGIRFQFPEHYVPRWLPRIDNRHIYQEYFLAVENNKIVRGGYILKHQNFLVNGQVISIADYQLPISEGIIDRAYMPVAVQLLADALQRQPLLYGLGMGGLDEPLPRFLKAVRWDLHQVPFYFRVVNPSNFLRNIRVLRTSIARKAALDFLAASGIGWAGIKLYQAMRSTRATPKVSLEMEPVNNFADWADDIWNRSKRRYRLAAVRDGTTLNILYPKDDRRFIRLNFRDKQPPVGWVVALDTAMKAHRQFGNMRVGSIVDCLALPGYEEGIIAATTKFLQARGVDILLSNQSHASWCSALAKSGYLRGRSNFAFTVSPQLAQMLGTLEQVTPEIHLNRGDGDGPINL